MKWTKKGRIYFPSGEHAWAKRYGYLPTPCILDRHTLRVYVCFTDKNTVGRVGFVDVDPENPSKIIRVSENPVFDIGTPGAFDENGVVPTCVINVDGEFYLYYVGFQLGYKVRYFMFEGLAISNDGGYTFSRHSKVPILERSDKELLNRTGAFVMHDDGIFKMWYVAGSEWVQGYGKMLPKYNIKYLESDDGKEWGDEGRVSIDFKNNDEHGLARPWVVKDGEKFTMFHSIRAKSVDGYRLGYAESTDGMNWIRQEQEVGIDVSESGWDSQMVEYSSILQHKHKTYMFYCGNNCGETGFGYAILDEW